MKIKILSLAMALALLLCIFSACGCKHEWTAADCTTPKTCSLCKETEGDALGHKWLEATCTAAKSCKNCDTTEGDPLGHDWVEATTEAPTTCTRCKVTEGKKIETDPRFTTESTKEFYGTWTCDVVLTGEMLGLEGYIDELPCTLSYNFENDGDVIADIELEDYFAFIEVIKKITKDSLVSAFISEGVPEAQIDEAMVSAYGMTLDEYVNEYVDSIDMDEIFGMFTSDWVYYVGQNGIYMSESWYSEFECSEYTIDGDTLVIETDTLEEGGEPLQWKRVIEE